MVARAGQRDEAQVALERHRLGFARNSRQAEAARALAFGHDALADEVAVFAGVDDQRAEIARIGQRAAHRLRVGDAQRAVGEGDGAGLGEQADLGDLAPLEPLGQRRGRQHPHLGGGAGAAQDEIDHRGIVDRRIGVGPRHQRRHPARRRGGAGGGDGLAMLRARLADEGAHVDQAGGDDVAAAFDDLRFGRNRVAPHRGTERGDLAVDDQRAAARFLEAVRINQPGVEKGDRAGLRHANGISRAAPRRQGDPAPRTAPHSGGASGPSPGRPPFRSCLAGQNRLDGASAARGALPAVKQAPVAQLDRAPDYESGGRGFESLRARHSSQRLSLRP